MTAPTPEMIAKCREWLRPDSVGRTIDAESLAAFVAAEVAAAVEAAQDRRFAAIPQTADGFARPHLDRYVREWAADSREREAWKDRDSATYAFRAKVLEAVLAVFSGITAAEQRATAAERERIIELEVMSSEETHKRQRETSKWVEFNNGWTAGIADYRRAIRATPETPAATKEVMPHDRRGTARRRDAVTGAAHPQHAESYTGGWTITPEGRRVANDPEAYCRSLIGEPKTELLPEPASPHRVSEPRVSDERLAQIRGRIRDEANAALLDPLDRRKVSDNDVLDLLTDLAATRRERDEAREALRALQDKVGIEYAGALAACIRAARGNPVDSTVFAYWERIEREMREPRALLSGGASEGRTE